MPPVPEITCKDSETIANSLNNISVANKVLYKFFDPFKINGFGDLDVASHYTNTTIISDFGQVRRIFTS